MTAKSAWSQLTVREQHDVYSLLQNEQGVPHTEACRDAIAALGAAAGETPAPVEVATPSDLKVAAEALVRIAVVLERAVNAETGRLVVDIPSVVGVDLESGCSITTYNGRDS